VPAGEFWYADAVQRFIPRPVEYGQFTAKALQHNFRCVVFLA